MFVIRPGPCGWFSVFDVFLSTIFPQSIKVSHFSVSFYFQVSTRQWSQDLLNSVSPRPSVTTIVIIVNCFHRNFLLHLVASWSNAKKEIRGTVRVHSVASPVAGFLFQHLDKNEKSGSIELGILSPNGQEMGSAVALKVWDTTNKVVKSHLQISNARSGWNWIGCPKMEKTEVFLPREQSMMIRQVLS